MKTRNPKYSSPDNSTIDVEINHPDYGWIPFTASPKDVEPLGRDLYKALSAGQVAPYDGPSQDEIKAQSVRSERDRRLQELDAVVTNPMRWAALDEQQQKRAATYRQSLLDVPQRKTFPNSIHWPQKPDFME